MKKSSPNIRRTLFSCLLIATLHSGHSLAGMIATEQVISPQQLAQNKKIIASALTRDDVKQALIEHGVDPHHAQQRVDKLTPEEIHTLATKMDELPAVGGVGLILFATGPIILMLELMGYTDLTTTF